MDALVLPLWRKECHVPVGEEQAAQNLRPEEPTEGSQFRYLGDNGVADMLACSCMVGFCSRVTGAWR